MPGHLIPRKSGVHRTACYALSRALLRQVEQLPLAAAQQKTVGDQIRTVIKRNAKLQSPGQVSTALDLGYETLGVLRSQTAWKNILMRILEVGAQRTAAHRHDDIGPQSQTAAPKKPKLGPNGAHQRVWPYASASKTLDRPFATLSGRRRVPKLVNANRVPLLRLKKPQSPSVSRIIRDTIDTRERRITLANQLDEQLPIARDEDEWDAILLDQFGLEEDRQWSYELRLAISENGSLQAAATQKRTDLAAHMHSIVQQEKALAMEEKSRIRNERHKRRKVRRLARRGQATPVVEQDMTLDGAELASLEVKSIGKDPEEKTLKGHVPGETVPEVIVRDTKKFQTKEELERIRAANAEPRTEDEIAEIKAARARRKDEAAKKKVEKIRRKEESVKYWQQKLGTHPNYTVSTPDRLSPPDLPTGKKPYALVFEGLCSEASKAPVLQRKPRKSAFRTGETPEYSAPKEQAKIY